MKKVSKILSLIFAFILTISLVACNDNKGKEETNEQVIPENFRMLYQFEDKSEFLSIVQENYFGKYSLNTDKKYVKQGNASIKLQPTGEGFGSDEPTLCLYPEVKEKGLENLSRVDNIVFDLYNDNDEVKECYVSLTFSLAGKLQDVGKQPFFLQPKTWTRCVYAVRYNEWGYVYPLEKCEMIKIAFKGIKEGDTIPVYYMDNMMLNVNPAERGVPEFELEEGEICDFEKPYQKYINYITGYGNYTNYIPEMSINTDKRYVSHGEKSLKLVIPHGYKIQDSYVRIMFAPAIIDAIDFKNIGPEYDIVFDVYNNSKSMFYIESAFRTHDGELVHNDSYDPTPYTWVSCHLSMKDMLEFKVEEGEESFVNQVETFEFNYGEFPGEDKEIYVDNFRIEKVR